MNRAKTFLVSQCKKVDGHWKTVLTGNALIKIPRTGTRIYNCYIITGKGGFCSINRLAMHKPERGMSFYNEGFQKLLATVWLGASQLKRKLNKQTKNKLDWIRRLSKQLTKQQTYPQ